ncbi:MAG: cytochrome c [Myxococcales bacterium]|nr:cytochrome c [Myxococcales bacterium]
MPRAPALVLALALVACGSKKPTPTPMPTPAEMPPPVAAGTAPPAEERPGSDVLAASALAEQYEVGKEVYAKACASCHGDKGEGNPKNPAVVGDGALPENVTFPKAKLRKGVTFQTAKDVFDFIKKNMPLDKKGSLSDDEYLAVLAWDLNENKVVLDAKLTAANLATIKLR